MAAQGDELPGGRPWSPPIVELAGDGAAHLLCWEQHEQDGSWHAWVSWIQSTGDPVRHRHHVVSVRAGAVRPLELFQGVARRVSDMLWRPVVSYANGREIVIIFGQEEAPALVLHSPGWGVSRRVLLAGTGRRRRALLEDGRTATLRAVTDCVIAAAAHQIDCGALARLAEQHHREDTDR